MSETDIPAAVRKLIDERDKFFCRVCGIFCGKHRRAIHHCEFGGDARGMGGRRVHDPDKMLSVCWLPGDNNCHQRLHADKERWQVFALVAAVTPGVTVLALERASRGSATAVGEFLASGGRGVVSPVEAVKRLGEK